MAKKVQSVKSNSKALFDKAFKNVMKSISESPKNGQKDVVIDINRHFLEGPFKERRKKVLSSYYNKVMDSFSHLVEKESGVNVFECFAYTELMPFNNYNLLDYWGAIRVGAAIWILDRIAWSKSIQVADVWNYIPDPDEVLGTEPENHFYRVLHPVYPAKLIEGMVLAITFRYLQDLDTVKNYHFSSCLCPDELMAGKPLNEKYQKLLEMIPQEEIDAVCNVFRQKVWTITELAMESQAYFANRLNKLSSIIEGQLGGGRPMVPQQPIALLKDHTMLELPVQKMAGKPFKIFRNTRPKVSNSQTLGLDITVSDLTKYKEQFQDCMSDFDLYLGADSKKLEESGFEDGLLERLKNFKVVDPYAMCFALLYLLDKGDDSPWLMYSGGALMSHVYSMLPWNDTASNSIMKRLYNGEETEEEPDDISSQTYDYYGKRINGLTMAQIIYRACRVVLPFGHSGFYKKIDKITEGKCDEALVAHMANMAGVLGLKGFGTFIPQDIKKQDNQDNQDTLDETKVLLEEKDKEIESLKKTAETTQEENEKLRNSLEWMERNVDKTVTEFEKLLKEVEKDRDELKDLRELVFNSENGLMDDESIEKKEEEEDIKYPYSLQKKMIVFGGHDTFLKVMRQNFPDTRFAGDKVSMFNPSMLKNVDIVWVQTNSISHSLYWSIVKYVGLYGKQLRYFTSGGIERCSRQMVEADRKS